MRVGEIVRIARAADETLEQEYIGCVGTIVELNYNHGCGEVRGDPLITVDIGSGVEVMCWTEDLVVQIRI